MCGTRLMIITNNRSTAAFGGAESFLRPTVEEHALERISALESALQRANEHIDMLVDMLQQQGANAIYDHAMIEAVVDSLTEQKVIDSNRLETLWRTKMANDLKADSERERLARINEQIIRSFAGENFDLFARLIDTGHDLFLEGNSKRGIRYFEKALVLDPRNTPLAFFIGEHFFSTNKQPLARVYLERAISGQEDNCLGMLMLGVICGDEGDIATAKNYLLRALKLDRNSFTAHYGLGRILASEGRLREAIAHLKRALTLKPSPEMYYLVGRAYLEEGQTHVAMRHLRRCIEMDPNFDAALYHLGLIYLGQKNLSLAQQHFKAAYEINPKESRYRVALRARSTGRLAPLPAFGRTAITSRKVVTSGDARLSELLRDDLLRSRHTGEDEITKGQKRS